MTINKDDQVLFTNIPKIKHLPKTKLQGKYFGTHKVLRVTESHVVISKEELGSKTDRKIPIHTARLHIERSEDLKVKKVRNGLIRKMIIHTLKKTKKNKQTMSIICVNDYYSYLVSFSYCFKDISTLRPLSHHYMKNCIRILI